MQLFFPWICSYKVMANVAWRKETQVVPTVSGCHFITLETMIFLEFLMLPWKKANLLHNYGPRFMHLVGYLPHLQPTPLNPSNVH